MTVKQTQKYTIQLVQLNNRYGSQVYLPYSVGMLKSFALKDEKISQNFKFKKFIFLREKISEMVSRIGNVDIFGISCYVWNWSLSLKLAEEVRKNNPECLIIFGGPQVPNNVSEFFNDYSFIDLTVHGEGEVTFQEILNRYYDDGIKGIREISGTTFYDRATGKIYQSPSRPRITDLNIIPSPYLEGIFEDMLDSDEYSWMITWETNRGCPFKCSFCDWGSAIASKVRKFDENRLLSEIDYFTEKKVDLVFGADANFGIFKRDKEFAIRLAHNKKQTGYPSQFRVCFTKNTTDRVFELAQIFSDAGMNKGVSISMQSLNSETLENIQRKNIRMKFFNDLQKKYVEAGLVTYTELILPLPGETYDSFMEGVDSLLDSSQHSGIVIYNCSIMPNAEMGESQYQERYGLDMIEIPIFQAHSDLKEIDEVSEKEIIVVGTQSMSREDYRKTYKFAWIVQSMHLLGLLQVTSIVLRHHFGIRYSDFYSRLITHGENNPLGIIGSELKIIDSLLDGVFCGKGFGQSVPEFEDITWPPEEATFLRISENLEDFYLEIEAFLYSNYLILLKDRDIITDVLNYQKNRLVNYHNQSEINFDLAYNIHEYFEESRAGVISQLETKKSNINIVPDKLFDDKKTFSREVVWYGRKGGKFFHPIGEVL